MKGKNGTPPRAALKENYLTCLRARSPRSLRKAVKALIHTGVSRDLLFAWAIQAGHNKKYVGKLLSECFCDLGLRLRKKGAGRPSSFEGILVSCFTRELFGERHRKCLRAASRVSKKRRSRLIARELKLIPVPELYIPAIERFLEQLRKLISKRPKRKDEPYDHNETLPSRRRSLSRGET